MLYAMKVDRNDPVNGFPVAPMPTQERAELLRKAYNQYVTHPDGHWKGRAQARLHDKETAALVAEAMDFMGSIVDEITLLPSGAINLYSDGYWAHGF